MSGSDTNNSSVTNWALVDSLTDEMIDRSEVPPLDESFFARAVWRMPEGQVVVALHKAIIEDFAAHWATGGVLVYASGSGEEPGTIDPDLLADLGIAADAYDKLPDVVLHDPLKNRLFLVESITSHGPVDEQRRVELARLFFGTHAHLILVTASPNRSMIAQYALDIAWETEAWAADEPAHLIHFDGERFCGPYDAS